LKPPKRPLPTTFLPQKAYFQSDRIFYLSFQRLSRVTYLYRRNLQPIRRTNYLPTEAIECSCYRADYTSDSHYAPAVFPANSVNELGFKLVLWGYAKLRYVCQNCRWQWKIAYGNVFGRLSC
jgi:hypothetical protein